MNKKIINNALFLTVLCAAFSASKVQGVEVEAEHEPVAGEVLKE